VVLVHKNKVGFLERQQITNDARYSVTFSVTDLAGNTKNETKDVIVDSVPPNIFYTTGYTLNNMNLIGVPGIINKDDLRRYYLNYVWDDVDGLITNDNVNITILSGITNIEEISNIGQYTINFNVSDVAENITTGTTTLNVE
jgi:hypothetical protein